MHYMKWIYPRRLRNQNDPDGNPDGHCPKRLLLVIS